MNSKIISINIPKITGVTLGSTLDEIGECETKWISKIDISGLEMLYRYYDDLMHVDSLKVKYSGETSIATTLHQTVVRIALLSSRERLLEKLKSRIGYLRRKEGYPTHAMIESRHEDKDYEPENFPNWSEKKWRGILHRIRKDKKESAYRDAIERLWEERREEEGRIQKEEAVTRLCATMKEVGRVNMARLVELQSHIRQSVASQVPSRDQGELNTLILEGFYGYVGAFSESELYFALDYNMSERKNALKKDRKMYDAIIQKIQKEMQLRGLSYATKTEISAGHRAMTSKDREDFINQAI